jgi:hypothetical protein
LQTDVFVWYLRLFSYFAVLGYTIFIMTIYLQTDTDGPRLRYAADFLLGQILGFDLVVGQHKEGSDVLQICYGNEPVEGAKIFIPAHPFLNSRDKHLPPIEIISHQGLPAFFESPAALKDNAMPVADDRLPFDLFAMTFYLLSRMEEYNLTVQFDQHQRFPASASLAFRAGFLEQPLLDQWAWALYSLLQKQHPLCPDRKPQYHFIPTIDVDFAWAYLHKDWKRTTGIFLNHLLKGKWSLCLKQLKVKAGWIKDPYDTYSALMQIHKRYDVKALFFMLLGTYGAYDKNNSPQHPAMQQLIRTLTDEGVVGIHPSYKSNTDSSILCKEIKMLEKAGSKPVTISRQHFLKLSFPETYRRLLAEGIQEDYSMGFADSVGFRASTAHPFYWYDLEQEKTTHLRIVPFAVMDVTLKNYMRLSPEEALTLCQKIITQYRNSGGTFCLLWHNSSFSAEMGWEDWGEIYEKIVALASGND